MAAAARREAVAAVVRTAGLTGEAAATSGAAARGGQRRGAPASEAPAPSEGRRREMEGGGDGGEGRGGGGGGGGGENGGTEFVSVSGAAAGGGAAAALSLFERCFEPGIPCHCDRRAREQRSRARRIHDARAIFAESGPQREAVFSADVQRRARKQAQRRRCRAAWASRVQWRGAAGSDVHRVAPSAGSPSTATPSPCPGTRPSEITGFRTGGLAVFGTRLRSACGTRPRKVCRPQFQRTQRASGLRPSRRSLPRGLHGPDRELDRYRALARTSATSATSTLSQRAERAAIYSSLRARAGRELAYVAVARLATPWTLLGTTEAPRRIGFPRLRAAALLSRS